MSVKAMEDIIGDISDAGVRRAETDRRARELIWAA
jgi:hypothetical protein